MLIKEGLRLSIFKSRWIILAAFFFIFLKFLFLNIQFDNGLEAGRFGDIPTYIHHIETVRGCHLAIWCKEFLLSFQGYGGFEHLTYRLFWGSLAHILALDATVMFVLSFYLGTLMAIPVLIFLLHRLHPDKNLIAFSLFFLALFNGAGSYHGFFWIVPSFFSLLFFLAIFSVVIGEYAAWKKALFLLIPPMLYTHLIGLYFLTVLPLFALLLGLLDGKIQKTLLKKSCFAIAVGLLFYIPTSLYLRYSPYQGNIYGPESLVKAITSEAISSGFFPGFDQIRTDYFDWIFPYWWAVPLFVLMVLLLHHYRQHRILALYFSSLLFSLLASMSVHGVRSLLLTWPITFILYANGFLFFFKFIKEKVRIRSLRVILQLATCLGILLFTGINIAYSYIWNTTNDISIKEVIRKL
jgi:hypothetical protein